MEVAVRCHSSGAGRCGLIGRHSSQELAPLPIKHVLESMALRLALSFPSPWTPFYLSLALNDRHAAWTVRLAVVGRQGVAYPAPKCCWICSTGAAPLLLGNLRPSVVWLLGGKPGGRWGRKGVGGKNWTLVPLCTFLTLDMSRNLFLGGVWAGISFPLPFLAP